jgi:hypothetical protein
LPIPAPDRWEFPTGINRTCLLTDDGTPVTGKLANLLTEAGWQVVILTFPQSILTPVLSLSENFNRVWLKDLSEEHLQQQLAAIAKTFNGIEAFIHLHPRSLSAEKAILKYVFLLAKHLKSPLEESSLQGRSCFMTVVRLDGEFGLAKTNNFSALAGGLFGLTKTLNLEWSNVFCRSIDLSPDLNLERAALAISNELYDPNASIVEVGHTFEERFTLVCEAVALK